MTDWNPGSPEVLGLSWFPTDRGERVLNAPGKAAAMRLRSYSAETIDSVSLATPKSARLRVGSARWLVEVFAAGNEVPGAVSTFTCGPNGVPSNVDNAWKIASGTVVSTNTHIINSIGTADFSASDYVQYAGTYAAKSGLFLQFKTDSWRANRRVVGGRLNIVANRVEASGQLQVYYRPATGGNFALGEITVDAETREFSIPWPEMNPSTNLPWTRSDIRALDDTARIRIKPIGVGRNKPLRVYWMNLELDYVTENRVATGRLVFPNAESAVGVAQMAHPTSGNDNWAKADATTYTIMCRRIPRWRNVGSSTDLESAVMEGGMVGWRWLEESATIAESIGRAPWLPDPYMASYLPVLNADGTVSSMGDAGVRGYGLYLTTASKATSADGQPYDDLIPMAAYSTVDARQYLTSGAADDYEAIRFLWLESFGGSDGAPTAALDVSVHRASDDVQMGTTSTLTLAALRSGNSVAGASQVYSRPPEAPYDVWKCPPGPEAVCLGPDGSIWFTLAGDSIGSITPSGVITEFTDANIDTPSGICAGPDGFVWFTSTANVRIGKIDPATGTITTYNSVVEGPKGIVAGPDGLLWFTAATDAAIGKITSGGSVTFYTPADCVSPQGICVAGGKLWYASQDNARINGIATDGTGEVSYATGVGASPNQICLGPDGLLWYTRTAGAAVCKIDSATGTVTTYTTDVPAAPRGILSDGTDLWFANESGVSKITTSGVVTNYEDPSVVNGYGVALGPDGRIWFGSNGFDVIGSFNPDPHPGGDVDRSFTARFIETTLPTAASLAGTTRYYVKFASTTHPDNPHFVEVTQSLSGGGGAGFGGTTDDAEGTDGFIATADGDESPVTLSLRPDAPTPLTVALATQALITDNQSLTPEWLVTSMEYVSISWESTMLGPDSGDLTDNFVRYEIERSQDNGVTWEAIFWITDEAVEEARDYEALRNVEALYRIRVVASWHVASDWVTSLAVTPEMDECALLFTSNEDPSLNQGYVDVGGTRSYNFQSADERETHILVGRNYQVTTSPLEYRGDRFEPKLATWAGSVPTDTGRANFDRVEALNHAATSYVCVLDETGRRWLADVVIGEGERTGNKVHEVTADIIEVTDAPSLVDVAP